MKPRSIILLLALAAFFAKLYCAATTFGSSDALTFIRFGQYLNRFGLIAMYRETTEFNHTPLVGYFIKGIYVLAAREPQLDLFNFYLRLPAIFADLLSVLALLWLREKTGQPAWWAIGVFAASPVSFMVSGFHGNVDSLMVFGLLLAAIACVVERPALSGLFLGLSCNIKIVPIFLVPAFFFFWWQRRRALHFSLPTAAVTLVGWAYPLFTIPRVFLHDVLGYSSNWGIWGIPYAFVLSGLPGFRDWAHVILPKTPTENAATFVLKLCIVLGVLLLCWQRRKVEGAGIFKTLALAWGVFFVFAPGFGTQYLVWLAPFFLVAEERWYAAVTAASSFGLFVFYTASCREGIPWNRAFYVLLSARTWTPCLAPVWLLLAAFLVRTLQVRFARVPHSPAGAVLLEAPEQM